jgi:hypothetical protein
MKTKLKILMTAFVAVVATAMLAVSLMGCVKLWEDEWRECIPLPETEIPINPEPWEDTGTDEATVRGQIKNSIGRCN